MPFREIVKFIETNIYRGVTGTRFMGVNTPTRLCSLTITLLLVCSALAVVPAPAAAAPTELTECGTISESGTYVLTGDLVASEGTCLTIDAPDVTIDGQGNSVVAPNADPAIAVESGDVTLTNLHVVGDGGMGTAITGSGVQLTVTDSTLTDFEAGIRVTPGTGDGTDLVVRNVDIETRWWGIIHTTTNSVVVENVRTSGESQYYYDLFVGGPTELTNLGTDSGTISGTGQEFLIQQYPLSVDGKAEQSPVFVPLDVEGERATEGEFTVTDAPEDVELLQTPVEGGVDWQPAPDALTVTAAGPTLTMDTDSARVLVSEAEARDGPADFEVTSLDVSDETPGYGETVNVTVTVENVGGASGSYVTNFNDGFDSYGSDRVELAPGESATFTYSYTVESYGDAQLFLRSDHLVTLSVER